MPRIIRAEEGSGARDDSLGRSWTGTISLRFEKRTNYSGGKMEEEKSDLQLAGR